MAWIAKGYLKDPNRTREEIAATVSAIGIHGSAPSAITRPQAQQSLRLLFTHHPSAAGLAAPHFEKWQDWSVADAYRTLAAKSDPVDPAITAFLEACPPGLERDD